MCKRDTPTTLNLGLSGLPFNGPDVGGFGDDASPRLMLDWIKACFLFPFFRNHSVKDSKPQEPWRYSAATTRQIAKYIRLRYRFLPYLYNLFAEQEETGEPILRPLMAEFESPRGYELSDVVDQFLVGPSVLQAPLVKPLRRRCVVLPGAEPWLDAGSGEWVAPGARGVTVPFGRTPLYLRYGAIVSTAPSAKVDLREVQFLVAARPGGSGASSCRYHADDGLSYRYRDGERTTLEVRAKWKGTSLDLEIDTVALGFGEIRATFALLGAFDKVRLNGRAVKTRAGRIRLTGRALPVRLVGGG